MTNDLHNNQTVSEASLDPRYVRRLLPDEAGGFTATIHELPGCIAEGDSAAEALENLERVALSWMESAKHSGYPISEPMDFSGASGKIALRISRRIHQQAAERADLEGTSLNQLIAVALASYLGQQDGMIKCLEAVKSHLHAHVSWNYISNWQAAKKNTEMSNHLHHWRLPRMQIEAHTNASPEDLKLTVIRG